jgi:[ribosomal protein S18]-alanine N-acetyltransferase
VSAQRVASTLPDPVIRPAAIADLDAMAAIEGAAFADPWPREAFASLLEAPHAWVQVAEARSGPRGRGAGPEGAGGAGRGDGTIVGYVVAWFIVDQAEVANLAVAPDARVQGVGGRLLDAALAAATTAGTTAIFLEVRESNEAARRLYASRGFAEIGRRKRYYRHPVEDGLVLRRDLTPSTTVE